jgi:tRNA(Arg) A34 adenosine deaminase TadA
MKYQLAAVIFDGREIIGIGYNKMLRSKVAPYSIHAEVSAIRWAIKKHGADRLDGCDMYVYRAPGNLARPCPCCQTIIEAMGIRRVFFSQEHHEHF